MSEEELDYETISQLFQKERKVSRLTEITPDFYEAVSKYLTKLEQEYSKESNKNPTSPTTLLLREEHLKITKLLKQIYEIRERKVVLSALNQVKGVSHEISNITRQEQELLDNIVNVLERTRAPILQLSQPSQGALESNDAPPIQPSKTSAPSAPAEEQEVSMIEDHEPEPEEVQENSSSPDRDFIVALVLEDLSSFVGTDLKTYNLKKEEVVCLPKNVATVLLKTEKIRILEPASPE